MTANEHKIILKEKDYQLNAAKRRIPFKHSFIDPLLRPLQSIKSRNKPFPNPKSFQLPSPQLTNNILSKAVKTHSGHARTEQELQTKIEVTPWTTILQSFLKSYDVRKDSKDLQISNPFGTQGLKMQDQTKGATIQAVSNEKDQRGTISAEAYIRILNNMKSDLESKWKLNDRVGSLQIVIQACKILHDTSHAKFHALKFAYVIEVVELFGTNVFKRIISLSFPNANRQKFNIAQLRSANIPESAQEVCRNWLHKISSIRQILPRAIIETTLLRLHFFLDNGSKIKKVLQRLSKSNRCIGEHINCIFYCTFLVRMGAEVLPQNKDFILDILDDVFFYIKQGKTKFSRPDVSYDEFFTILEPFFISTFQSLAQNLQTETFRRFCRILPQNAHPVILRNFIGSFSPSLLVYYCTDLVRMVQKLYKENKYPIYKLLFMRLRDIVFPQSGDFIVSSWTDISQITDPSIMLDLLGPYSSIIFRNLPNYEKNKFYALILDTFNKIFYNFRNIHQECYHSFQLFLTDLLANIQFASDILMFEPFLHLIGYFPKQVRVELSENIVRAFLKRQEQIKDPILATILLNLMKNCQNAQKEALQFLEKVNFESKAEDTLNFYCDFRAAFGQFELITVSLIYRAAGLTFKARQISNGRVTNKLLSFLQATLAYCFITVPMLTNPNLRLNIYLHLSQVALSNNLISQATELIKTCITQLSEEKGGDDQKIFLIFSRIISFLVVMPDDPDQDYLFLFNGLLQAFKIAKFTSNFEPILRFQFFTKCVVYLSCQAQQRLPFHLQGVVSNDGLFKSVEFRQALIMKLHAVIEMLEELIPSLGENTSKDLDAYLITHLSGSLMTLITTFEITPRLNKILKGGVKWLEKVKERLFAKEPGLQGKLKISLMGLNDKFKENDIELSVRV